MLVGNHSESGEERVLAEGQCREYTLANVESLIGEVLERASLSPAVHPSLSRPRLVIRVWSAEGLRSCLNLSAESVRQIAQASALVEFEPYTFVEPIGAEQSALREWPSKPELVVIVVGDSPQTGKEVVLASAERQWYTLDELQLSVAEVLALALQRVDGDVRLWMPQLGVRLASDRGLRPALHLPAALIAELASCGASLDFDPYV